MTSELVHQSGPSFINQSIPTSTATALTTFSSLLTRSVTHNPYILATIIFLLLVSAFIYLYCDFQAFLALGPGGTPSTVAGYIRVKLLGLLALKDPYKIDEIASKHHGANGNLNNLPDRGLRPVTRGIAPHRQMTQRADTELYQKLARAVNELGISSEGIRLGTSCFEKHSTGLFAVSPITITCKGEICHVHPSDGSMHLTLHPADAKIVLEGRWGERHPLARNDRLAYFVPESFLMVYAPRTEADIEIVLNIVRAAAWFVGGAGGIVERSVCQEVVNNDPESIITK